MEFRILGGLEVSAAGRSLALGDRREQVVLAVLLLEANQVVPIKRLVEAVWDQNPPATADKQVRNAVARLRRLLPRDGAGEIIATVGNGYRATIPTDGLDSQQFEADVARAEKTAAGGDLAHAVKLLDRALSRWRGAALAGMSGRVLETAAASWNERRCAVQLTRVDYQLALGRPEEVVTELVALVGEHPLWESSVQGLMIALHRCGRKADALAAYDAMRARLADDAGLDPSAELRQLRQQILTDQLPSTSALSVVAASHAPQPTPGVPKQLPTAIQCFAGRVSQLATLDGLLENNPAVGKSSTIALITGTAGVGKTALAVYWAHRAEGQFGDGQLYVNLHGFDPTGTPMAPYDALRGFLYAFGVPADQQPADVEAQAALYRSLIASKRMMVVLDNARDSEQVRLLLPGHSRCLTLITSRSQLTSLVATEGALPVPLDLMTAGEAYDLLARRLGPGRLKRETAAVAEIDNQCAGLPLVLSIAAAHAVVKPALPLADLARRLRDARDRLGVLGTGDAITDVRCVFSWSYRSLSASAARTFRMLATHPGPDISAPVAASLTGAELTRVLGDLTELAQANLLFEDRPGRYSFHDLLRVYAYEQMTIHDNPASRRAATHRLLDHYLGTAHTAALLLDPTRDPIALPPPAVGLIPEDVPDGPGALVWYDNEYRALLATIALAHENGLDRYVWQLAWTLVDYCDRRGYWRDLTATQDMALAAARRCGDRYGQARIHRGIGRAQVIRKSYQEAHVHLLSALDLHRQLGDLEGEARIQRDLGWLFDQQGRFGEALTHACRALDIVRKLNHRRCMADLLNTVGWCYARVGECGEAQAHCELALDLMREFGDRHGEADTWDSLGYIYHLQRKYTQAVTCYERAVELYRETGDSYYEADTLTRLGETYRAAGRQGAMRAAWEQALRLLDGLCHADAEPLRVRLKAI